jgi:arylsulfatase A-like enzyme
VTSQSERPSHRSAGRLDPDKQRDTGSIDRRDFLKQLSLLPITPLLDRVSRSRFFQERDRPNVIILLFDTLSARHMSLYGYHRETTPNLGRFARRATVYHKHYAAGNFTTPGTASLLTGTYSWTHRAFNAAGRMDEPFERKNLFELFGSTYNRVAYPHNVYAHLLLTQLRQSIDRYLGPQTFGLFDDMFYSPFLSESGDTSFRALEELLFQNNGMPGALFLGLINEIKTLISVKSTRRQFERLYPRGVPYLKHYQAYFLVEDVVRGASTVVREAPQPLLAYLHFFPPHEPYWPRAEFIDIFQDSWEPVTKPPHFFSEGNSQEELNQQRTWYDEYIAHVDAEFGRMVDSLHRDGLLRNSYIVITSDHGELFERGVRGHLTPLLYDPVIHVPLIISAPEQEERKDVHTPTSCVDVLPTLLHLTGQSVPDWIEGQLLPELGGERDRDRTVFAVEAKRNGMKRPLTQATVVMIKGTHKLIHYFGYKGYENEYELYDLENDPEELRNLYSSTNPIARDMQNQLKLKLQGVNRPYR